MGLVGPNLTSSDGTTAATGALGDTHWSGGIQYQYFKAGAALTAYQAVMADDTYAAALPLITALTTARPSSAAPTNVCIPQFAVASGEYFWAPVGPIAQATWDNSTTIKVLAAASCVLDVKLYTTAVDGVVDDAATTLIEGLFLTETITTARAASCQATQKLSVNSQS